MRTLSHEDDELEGRDHQAREEDKQDEFWQELAINLVRAALLAVVGVVVRELMQRLDSRRREYDYYDRY